MLLIALGVVILIATLLHTFFPRRYNWPSTQWKLRKIPGPWKLPYFGNILDFAGSNDEFLPNMMKIVDTFKPIVRIQYLGIDVVMVTDLDLVEVIMNNRQHITKSDDYNMLLPWLGTGLLTSTDEKWFNHRKWLTPAFHFGILEPYIDVFTKNSLILVNQIKACVKNNHVEINPLVTLCTLDIICETAMGTQVNAQLGGEKEYVKATLRMSQLFQIRQLRPWMYRDWLFQLSATGKEQRKVLATLHGFTERVIKERKETIKLKKEGKVQKVESEEVFGGKVKTSFLDLLIEISETDNRMTEEEIREEVDTFMFEGHDTTSAAITWAMFLLGSHPEIQEKAYQELYDIFGDSERASTFQDTQEMKYLERVIKETLRLYPSVPVISRKLDVDIKMREYDIPAGTNVPIFIYYIQRDPRLYPDPEKFDPDRFLPDTIQGRHPYSYVPFSAGPRNCIGQKFAMMEEKVVLSTILRNFKITSLDKVEDIKLMAELILRPKENLRMVFEPRMKSEH